MDLLERGITPAFERAIERFPVVVLEGGRAVGKSTLCRLVAERRGWPAITDLSDPAIVEALKLDPLRFLRDLPSPAFIDEAQIVPELPLWIKRIIDERGGAPAQFVLTGSARLGREQLGGSDPLAGRSVRLRMWSLTPSERTGNFSPAASVLFSREEIESAFDSDALEWSVRDWTRGGLPGLPGVLREGDQNEWSLGLASYIDSVVPLGVSSRRVDHARLVRTFRYLAANPAQQLNVARMANELQARAETLKGYLDSLEAAFLLFRVEAHRPTEHRVLTAHPRLHVTDIGFASWAARIGDSTPSVSLLGSLLENQIAHLLKATSSWTTDAIEVRHWRDQRAQHEVDLLLVRNDQAAIPIEVKAATSVGPRDTVGIRAFAAANPEPFVRGIVLYCGHRALDLSPPNLADRSVVALPIDWLIRSPISRSS